MYHTETHTLFLLVQTIVPKIHTCEYIAFKNAFHINTLQSRMQCIYMFLYSPNVLGFENTRVYTSIEFPAQPPPIVMLFQCSKPVTHMVRRKVEITVQE